MIVNVFNDRNVNPTKKKENFKKFSSRVQPSRYIENIMMMSHFWNISSSQCVGCILILWRKANLPINVVFRNFKSLLFLYVADTLNFILAYAITSNLKSIQILFMYSCSDSDCINVGKIQYITAGKCMYCYVI